MNKQINLSRIYAKKTHTMQLQNLLNLKGATFPHKKNLELKNAFLELISNSTLIKRNQP